MSDWDKVVSFDKPGPSSDWESVVKFQTPAPPPRVAAIAETEIGPFGAGVKGMGSDLRTAAAALGANFPATSKFLGVNPDELLKTAEESRAEVARRYKPKVPSFSDIGGLGDLGQYIYEKGAESLPQTGTALGAGALAMLAAPAAIPAAVAGVAAGTAAGLPFFVGQNIKEQMDSGKTLGETNLGVAAGAGAVQSALDTLVGKVLPGVGKAAAGGIVLRAVKKGIEGGAIEGLTEGAQQAIQIGQADPQKLWEFGPEVQRELAEAAVAGLALGGVLGGGSGAVNRRQEALSSPQADEPLGPPAPPEAPYYPSGTGLPGTFEPDPSAMFPPGAGLRPTEPIPYQPNRTGLPQQTEPWAPNPNVFGLGPESQEAPWYPNKQGLPGQETPTTAPFVPTPATGLGPETDLPWTPNGAGLPRPPGLPDPKKPFVPDPSVRGLGPETAPGQRVFRNIQQQLLAARQQQLDAGQKAFANPIQINAMARMWRERYETLAAQKGTDPYQEFANENLTVKQVAETPKSEVLKAALSPKGKTLKQDVILDPVQRDANFKAWAKGAPVVERATAYRGGPGVFKVFHGTTHTDIEQVDPTKGDMIGALGQGFYTTSNPEDASANYANRNGPDADYRIMRVADAKANKLPLRDWDEIRKEAATEVLGPSHGTVMPVYVRMNNPLDTRQSGTTFSGREYVRFLKAIRDLVAAHPDPEIDMDPAIALLNDQYESRGQVSARDAYDVLKKFGDVNPDVGAGGYGQFFQNIAKRMGYDGIIEPAGQRYPTMDGMTKDTLHIVPFDANQVKGQFNRGTFNESPRLMEQTAKGEIEILPNAALIRLFKNADASTFMHESAHLWLEGMVRNAPHNRQIAHDLQSVRDWLKNDGGVFTTAQHEQFARGFEQYLRTGKAPSRALADLFKQFAEWLGKIYKQATEIKTPDGKSVVVPPEIHKVYDRLFSIEGLNVDESRSSPRGDGDPLPISGVPQTHKQDSAFSRWFGASKVVGPDGNPLTLYHGTSKDKDFGSFKVGRHGAWFTTDPEAASQYAMENDSQGHRYENGNFNRTNTASRVMPVNLKIEKPYEVTPTDLKSLNREGSYKKIQSDFFDQLRRQGYDGVKYPGGVWVALKYPQQIKSIHNQGTYSDSPQILKQEETRTFQQAATETPDQNPTSVYNTANTAWGKISKQVKAFFDPYSEVTNESAYRDMRNLLGGRVMAAEKSAQDSQKLFSKLTRDEKDKVNTYFDTANADPLTIPQNVRAETVRLKRYINGELKQALIDNNLLPKDVAAKNDDSYLPRLYLKFLLEPDGFKSTGAKMAKTYAKKREDRTPEELLALGEIKDPGVRTFHALFRTQRDLAILDFLNKVAANGDWAHPKGLVEWNGHKVTPQWLKDEADHIKQHRAPAERPMHSDRADAMVEIADRMRETADKGIEALGREPYDNTQYRKLPDSYAYGPLRGMIVRNQIADDIIGTTTFVNPDNSFDKWFGDRNSKLTRGISYWKMLKVPLNPPSQMRNVASNMILLHLSGMPIHKIGSRMYQAARDMLADGKYSKIAKKYGIGQGTFTEQELFAVTDELKKLEASELNGFAGWRAIWRGLLKGTKYMSDIHQKMEVLGKVAKIADAMERPTAEHPNGMAENDAVREANKWLFDYSEAATSVKRIRNTPLGMPFLCVDTSTEILTQKGWKRHDEVDVGDIVASFSMQDERLHWGPILEMFHAPYKGDMVHVKNGKLDILMTPNHRNISYRAGKEKPEIIFAEDLNTQDSIPSAAPMDHTPIGPPMSDAMAELLGWYISEGHMHRKCSAVWINQNAGPKADQIRDVIQRCGFGYREDVLPPRRGSTKNEVHFYINAKNGLEVRDICPDKKLTPDIVMRMTVPQLRLFIDAFVAGDGSVNKNSGQKVIIQKDHTTLEALQMALTILGESYGVHLRTTGVSQIQFRRYKRHRLSRRPIKTVQFDGEIWCPRTTHGTWVARRNGKVFFSGNTFQYKMAPLLMEIMTKHPTRLLPYIALAYTVPALVAASNDIDDDDAEKLRKSLSQGLRRKNDMYLLPWKDDAGRWQFIDIGYFMPWQMPVDVGRNLASGAYKSVTGDPRGAVKDTGEAFRGTGLMSNPVLNVISALTTGVDPFTDRPIADKRDPPEKQVSDVVAYAWSLVAPSLLAGYGAAGQLVSRESGTGMNRYGEPQTTYGQIAARALGANVYPVVPDAQRARNLQLMRHEIQDAKGRMTSALKDQSLTPSQRREVTQNFRDDIIERTKEMARYAKESQPSPRLQAATARP